MFCLLNIYKYETLIQIVKAPLQGKHEPHSWFDQECGCSDSLLTPYLLSLPPTALPPVKAKFHYAIWSQTGLKLVADLQRDGIWPII